MRESALWLGATAVITGVFARLAVHKLADYRPVSNDEVELMAVGYKLATTGVLGSDMYVGFFGGDAHHFETLPLQHVLEALAFRVLGAGVLQARLVSVVAAVVLLWVVGWLAFRWYGVATAIVAELLLVAWRSNLTVAAEGLPLLGIARTARYDVLAVAAAWLAIAALEATLRRPSRLTALAIGVAAGLATLSQFFGVFTVALTAVAIAWTVPAVWRRSIASYALLGFVLSVTPYAIFALIHLPDALGQLSAFGDRGDFTRPAVLLQNIVTEPARYTDVLARADAGSGPWLLAVGSWPALAYLSWRNFRAAHTPGDRLLLLSIVTFTALLALLDRTKVPLYAVLLWPSICVCVAVAAVDAARWGLSRSEAKRARPAAAVVAAALAATLAWDSAVGYQAEWFAADRVTPYLALGEQIGAALPEGAVIVGPERWWWALREHPYVSLRNLWFQWSAGLAADFHAQVAAMKADTLVLNVNTEADIGAFPPTLQAQFWKYIADCTEQVARFDDANYFDTTVYRVSDDCR